ncbi:MAG: site-specific integrase [Puniceicoccales bacterium]|jgi:integrase|nr:site-specific integrase [Puniceicoccales bacterium]
MLSGTPPGGNRIREYFPSRAAAERRKAELGADITRAGFRAINMTADERREVADFKAILEPYGASLKDAVEFYADHLEQLRKVSSVTVREAVDRLLDIKDTAGLSKRYRVDLRQKCERFILKFGKRAISTITVDEIRRWLNSLKVEPVTLNNYKRNITVLFSFALDEGYSTENPAARIDFVKARQKAPGILRPDDMLPLLQYAREHHSDILAGVVIQCWAGLRRAEVEQLRWEDIRLEDRVIEVNAAAAKNNVRRPVHIEDNLAEWLMMLRQPSGPVTQSCYGPCLGKLRKAMLAQNPPATMPENCFRHSYGTYYCARSGSTHATADQMGNSPAVVKSHYRAVASKRNADKWFSITPASLGAVAETVSFDNVAPEASQATRPSMTKKAK